MADVRALLLDFNGTLSLDEDLWCAAYERVFADLGRPMSPSVWAERFVGRSDAYIVETWLGPGTDHAPVVRAVVAAYGDLAADGAAIPEHARRAVRAAAARVPVAVVSAAMREVVAAGLAGAGLSDQVAVVVAAEDVAAHKPSPEGYLTALAALGVPAARAVAVEDTPVGVRAARAAGLRCIGVLGTVEATLLGAAERCFPRLDMELVDHVLGGAPG